MQNLIKEIQKENIKIYMSITGGGSGAIANILQYGGSSEIFMEARVPYNQTCLNKFLGQSPEKYCSEQTARLMAVKSFESAFDKDQNNVGVGVTCSLAKENERSERENVAYIAIHSKNTTSLFKFIMSKKIKSYFSKKTLREQQEIEVSKMIIECIIHYLKHGNFVFSQDPCIVLTNTPNSDELYNSEFFVGLKYKKYSMHKLIMPGSYNPMHDSHKKIAKIASQLTDYPVTFEISMQNFEKPSIDFLETKKRLNQIEECLENDNDHVNAVILTNTPLFEDKVKIFKDSIFVIGYDTYNRIVLNLMKTDLNQFKNTKFLVFHRSGSELLNNQDWVIENKLEFDKLCTFIPLETYHDYDAMSSTKIRKQQECTQL